jgi:hypothetical protein
MGREELGFTIYCAGILAERLEITEREAYHLLCKGDIVDGYIVPCFDVLHTFSKDYIVDDLVSLLKKREVIK